MNCDAKKYTGKRSKPDCDNPAAFLLGTAKVPYCDECAKKFLLTAKLKIEWIPIKAMAEALKALD